MTECTRKKKKKRSYNNIKKPERETDRYSFWSQTKKDQVCCLGDYYWLFILWSEEQQQNRHLALMSKRLNSLPRRSSIARHYSSQEESFDRYNRTQSHHQAEKKHKNTDRHVHRKSKEEQKAFVVERTSWCKSEKENLHLFPPSYLSRSIPDLPSRYVFRRLLVRLGSGLDRWSRLWSQEGSPKPADRTTDLRQTRRQQRERTNKSEDSVQTTNFRIVLPVFNE